MWLKKIFKSFGNSTTKDSNAELTQVTQRPSAEESLQKLTNGLGHMLEQLDSICTNLDKHSSQNQELLEKISNLPEILKDIPEYAQKQLETFDSIKDKLEDNARTHKEMLDGFFKFNENLQELNSNSSCQNENLLRLGKSFTSSERYFKHMLDKQSKRFMWVFIISMFVSLSCVILAGWIAFKVVINQ